MMTVVPWMMNVCYTQLLSVINSTLFIWCLVVFFFKSSWILHSCEKDKETHSVCQWQVLRRKIKPPLRQGKSEVRQIIPIHRFIWSLQSAMKYDPFQPHNLSDDYQESAWALTQVKASTENPGLRGTKNAHFNRGGGSHEEQRISQPRSAQGLLDEIGTGHVGPAITPLLHQPREPDQRPLVRGICTAPSQPLSYLSPHHSVRAVFCSCF